MGKLLQTSVNVTAVPKAYIMSKRRQTINESKTATKHYIALTDLPQHERLTIEYINLSRGSSNSCHAETTNDTFKVQIGQGNNLTVVCGDDGYTPPPLTINTTSIQSIVLELITEYVYGYSTLILQYSG